MPNLGSTELLILLFVVVLIFGSAKLPQLARSLGKSARILKAETKGLRTDEDEEAAKQQQAQAAPQQPPVQQPYPQQQQPYPQQYPQQGQLPPGQPIQGVPVDPSQARDNR